MKPAPLDQLRDPFAARILLRAMMMNDAACTMDEQRPQIPVACFTDAKQFGLPAGRMLARYESEVSGELSPILEPLRLADRGDDGSGDQSTDAGDGGKLLADRVGLEDGFDPFVEQGEPFIKHAELIAQSVESLLRHRRETGDLSGELFAQPDEEARDAFGADNVVFEQEATDLIDERGAVMHEAFTDTLQSLEVLLIGGLDGHRPQVGTHRGFGNGGGIVAVVLGSLTEGDDMLSGNEHDFVSEFFQLTRPVLRAGAGLHRNSAAREIGEEERHFIAV